MASRDDRSDIPPSDQLKDLAHQAKEQTTQAARQAKTQVGQLVMRQKDEAAGRLKTLAEALREAGNKLEEREPDGFGRYADRAAGQVERLSDYVRGRDLQTLVHDVEGLARRHPDLFLGGALVAGVLLARFLKASAEPEPPERYPQPAYADAGYDRERTYGSNFGRSRFGGAATGTYGAEDSAAAGGL